MSYPGPTSICANYWCSLYGCQGHCGWRPPQPQYPGHYQAQPHGCICPAGAEKTCQGFGCPRKGIGPASGMSTGTAKTPKAVEGQSPASPVANGETPKA